MNIMNLCELEKPFDIVISGAGLVGASLALYLKNAGFSIALLEKTPILNEQSKQSKQSKQSEQNEQNDQKKENHHDARAICLAQSSVDFLQKIGVWDEDALAPEPIQAIHISSKGHFGITEISAKEQGLHQLGCVVNAKILTKQLHRAIANSPQVKIFQPNEIKKLEKMSIDKFDYWQIELNAGEKLVTPLLISSEGQDSYLRCHQGIEVKIEDYHSSALVSNIELNQNHRGIAYERFIEQGSIAMLPFGKNRVKCVICVPSEEADFLYQAPGEIFAERIQSLFGYRLGAVSANKISNRVIFPLKAISADHIYGQRFVLIGNAANTLHPVAAQGFNLGLRDVSCLVEVLGDAKRHQRDLGEIDVLSSYARKRDRDHLTIKQFTHKLTQMGGNSSIAIFACEFLPFVKNLITRIGMGEQMI